jgi:hypothetical protein
MSSKLKDALPLHVFIRKAKTIHLYRSMLKATRELDNIALREDIKCQIKEEFSNNKHHTDIVVIKSLLLDADRKFQKLKDLSSSPVKKVDMDMPTWLNNNNNNNEDDGDEDVKGRVGTGWPWDS